MAPTAASGRARATRIALLLIAYAGLAVAATFPVVLELNAALPRGSELVGTVPMVSAWSLWWNADRLLHGLTGYWDAPIFHPTRGVFAFSEPMPLAGLVTAPLFAAGASPALAHNLFLLAALVGNGLCAYALCRALRLPVAASALAGAVMLLLPFVHHQLGVLALVPLMGVLLSLHALLACARRPSATRGVAVGLGLALTFLLCAQYALFTALALVCALPLLWRFRPAQLRPTARALLAACAVTAVLAGPFAYMQFARTSAHHFERSTARAARGSANGYAWFRTPLPDIVPLPFVSVAVPRHKRSLFPGSVRLALAVAGAVFGLRRPGRRRTTRFLIAFGLTGIALSLFARLDLGALSPYLWARALVPGLGQVRSLWRAGVLTQIALVLLLAQGLHALFWSRSAFGRRWLARLPGRVSRAAVQAAIALLVLVELWPGGYGVAQVPAPAAARRFAAFVSADVAPEAPLALLPFPADNSVEAYEPTARFMYLATFHGRPMVNGYSSYFPERYEHLLRRMQRSAPVVPAAALEQAGVRTLVIDHTVEPSVRVPDGFRAVWSDRTLALDAYQSAAR